MTKDILIFDTISTGKPRDFRMAEDDLTNYPHLVQMSAKLITVDFDDLESAITVKFGYTGLVKYERKGESTYQDRYKNALHPFTKTIIDKEGNDIGAVALMFQGLTNSADFIIAHNFHLHRNIMASELLNLGIKPKARQGAKSLCLMKYTTSLVGIKGEKAEFQYPSIEQTYHALTNQYANNNFNFPNAEEAVNCNIVCLYELMKLDRQLVQWLKGELQNIY